MTQLTRKHFLLYFFILITLFHITYSQENDTSAVSQRHGRVSGRIVKLYSGPKPDPILCVSEGFLADTVDCSVFYRCLKASNGKYTVYRFQCGPGTVYDPDTEICNHPRSTKRLQCGGLSSDKPISSTDRYIGNEIDGLHKESEELPSPISTTPTKLSNSILNTIASPKPAKLETSYVTTSYPWHLTSENINDEYTTTSIRTTWSTTAIVSTKKPRDYTPTQSSNHFSHQTSIHSGVQCTSDGFIGDNEDCRKFYRCVNNQRGGFLRFEFSCSESTIWDDDTQGCNHPWAVQRRRCGKGNNYDENSINYGEHIKNNNNINQQQTQISYGSRVTQTPTQISTSHAVQNQSQIYFGDRINQNQTQINYEAPISHNEIQMNYGNDVTHAPIQVNYSNQFSQSPISDDSVSSTTIVISSNTGNSTSRCTEAGFLGDSNDCKKFYRCISDEKGGFTKYEFSCSEGTLWDEQLEACNHAWAVKKCGEKKSSQNISPATTITDHTTFKYATTTSLYSNEIDKGGYVSQNDQQEQKRTTISSTMQTTSSTMQTTSIESPKPYETDCISSGFFGNINDCTKFYRCVENGGGKFMKYDYKCGEGTVWDPEIESCNHAWSVKSCGTKNINGAEKENSVVKPNADNTIITTVSLIQTTTQKNIIDFGSDSGYYVINSETPTQYITTTERAVNLGNECKTSGFMGDTDCKKFYRCVENSQGGYSRHEFTCGEGTVWDSDIEACNHAWAVKKCGGIKDNLITSSPSVSEDNSYREDSYNTNQNNHNDPKNTIKTTTSKSTTNFVTTVTNESNYCQSNGFMGNDKDCKIFYRCVENGSGGFVRYEFSCGDGTVWDPKISACNHVWAVEKCGGSNSAQEYPSSSTENINFTTTNIGSVITTQYTTLSSSSSTLTSTIPDKNNECIAEGFIGNKQDCKKFYRCVEDGKGNYIRYEFTCGEGTVWDPKIQACNHAWAVESCGSNEPTVSESSLTLRPTSIMDEEPNNSPVTEINQHVDASTENNSLSTSTIKSSTIMGASSECHEDGFMGDIYDCKRFYRCVNDGKGNFIRYEFSCSDGTVWDSEINACNHVNSVKTPCNSQMTPPTKEKEPNHTVSGTSTEVNDYSTSSKKPMINDSQKCEQEGFFGDKTDCKKFYRCTDNGQGGFYKYQFTCGEGTVWDQEIVACNHASSNLLCASVDNESQTDNSNIHSTTPFTSTAQSTEKTQILLSTDECVSEGFYANSNDCKKFFRCVGNGKGGFTRYDFTCGEGTIWVQDIQACDHDSDTSLCSTTTIKTTRAPTHSNQEKPITTISTSTAKSTIKDTSVSESITKPTMQDEVSGTSNTLETSSTATMSTSASNQDLCEEAGYFGNTKNCKMFYRCVDNGKGSFTKYDFTCGDGTIWDQDIIACNHPQDVSNPSCENEGSTLTTTTTTTTTTTKTPKTTTVNNETSEPTKGTSSTESTTTQSSNQSNQEVSTKKPNSNSNYTCSEAGFYADPYDCKKFYRCVDWGGDGKTFSIYHFDCGEGTIWDPNLNTCNHEESVYPPRDCSGTQSQNDNRNDTTTTAKQEVTTETRTSEGSTTTSRSTTQKSTTQSSFTTTELSSTTDQTSTQSSSSEQTSSTQQSSTQSSTTEQSTTQKSTTEQSTTEQSTTKPNTTQQSTTEQSTTQSTTEQSTTQQSTTEQSTTQQSTTEQSTTQQSTTEQSTTEQSTTDQSTTQQSTTEQSTTQQSSTEQTTNQQSSTTQSSTTSEPAATTTTSTTTEQTTTGSTEETTTTTAQTTSESTTSTTDQTTKPEQSTTEQSSENQSSTTEQTTTQQTTDGSTTTESGQETTTEKESSDKECPQTDDDQYLFVCPTGFKRHPKYCNLFYQCTEDDDTHEMKVAVFHCPNNTIYDESKTQCVEEEKADKKCDGQIAQRRRVKRLDANYKEPMTVGTDKYFCTARGHFPFEKNEECSPVLFKCEVTKSGKLRGFIYRCPEGYVYWSISRRCEPISTMTDCKRSLSSWNQRYEIPIERNNVAKKSIT